MKRKKRLRNEICCWKVNSGGAWGYIGLPGRRGMWKGVGDGGSGGRGVEWDVGEVGEEGM